MKLRFTPRAAQDLASIAAYIRERNPTAALRVRAAILESLQSLVLFPRTPILRFIFLQLNRGLALSSESILVSWLVDQAFGVSPSANAAMSVFFMEYPSPLSQSRQDGGLLQGDLA
jgi:hypothetical protein